ncbi:hypothetical protein QTP88_005016 [Uroleucon formosanum]
MFLIIIYNVYLVSFMVATLAEIGEKRPYLKKKNWLMKTALIHKKVTVENTFKYFDVIGIMLVSNIKFDYLLMIFM